MTVPDDQYRRDEAAYKENCAFARGLNTQIMQVPAFAITLTGGLWFGAGVSENVDADIKFVLLSFAAIADAVLIIVLFRLRNVMQSYLDKAKAFNPTAYASGNPSPMLGSYAMVKSYAFILALAVAVSVGGAIYFWPWC